MLTHHYAYSAYESILGFLSKFGRTNNQVDTKLSEQLFEILPKVSVWYWGHEHRLSLMEPNAFGIPCTRTLGNSAFQVHKPKTYDVKYPDYNPIISKYNPGKNDDQNPTQPYFDHTGGIVTFSNDKINTQYIDMTSSYLQPSKVTR